MTINFEHFSKVLFKKADSNTGFLGDFRNKIEKGEKINKIVGKEKRSSHSKIFVQVLILLMLLPVVFADVGPQPSPQSQKYEEYIKSWMPFVLLVAVLDISIVGIIYAVGYAFNIDRLKSYAVRELPSVIGSLILAGLIIFALQTASSISIFYIDSFYSKDDLNHICVNIANGYNKQDFSKIDPSNSAYSLTVLYHLAYGPNYARAEKFGISKEDVDFTPSPCLVINDREGNEPYYILAASQLLLLNKTVRLINFTSYLYVFQSVLAFLANLESRYSITAALINTPVGAEIGEVKTSYSTSLSIMLYPGFTVIADSVKTMVGRLFDYISFYFLIMTFQLFVYRFWLPLLSLGLIFHAFSGTRKLGGFLIAFSVSTVFILPTSQILLFHAITEMDNKLHSGPITLNPYPPQLYQQYKEKEVCSDDPKATYNIKDLNEIPREYRGFCGCLWKPSQGLAWLELKQFLLNLLPLGLVESVENLWMNYPCKDLDNPIAYIQYLSGPQFMGRIAVEVYLVPVLSLIITLANILGLSSLIGGATTIFGLERLI